MENIIKKTCRELNLTQNELSILLGLNASSIARLARAESVSSQVIKACKMLFEIDRLKKENARANAFKKSLIDFIKD